MEKFVSTILTSELLLKVRQNITIADHIFPDPAEAVENPLDEILQYDYVKANG